MMQAIIITGDTYTHRREIKSLGGKWNPDEKGWLVPLDKQNEVNSLLEGTQMYSDTINTDPINLETPTGDRLRAIRQAKINRRAARLETKASRLEQEADRKQSAFNEGRKDLAWLTQPGHIPGRDKALNSFEKGMKLNSEALELRKQSEYLKSTKARVKGDAERARQTYSDKISEYLKPGSRIIDVVFGTGTVIKIFSKSCNIRWDRSGNTWAREKYYLKLLSE